MEACLKFVLNATPTRIHDHNQALISYLFERLPDGYRLASPRQASQRGAFGCIEVGSRSNTESLYQTLRDERFVVALREGRIRVAPHLRFAHRTADFLICGECDVFVAAITDAAQGKRAVINARALDGVSLNWASVADGHFDDESPAQRADRRSLHWTPVVM